MNRGISFLIPNEYGRFISDILELMDCKLYDWLIGSGHILNVVNDQLVDEELFYGSEAIVSGSELSSRINCNLYYTIFADLKGFPKGKRISIIETYEDYFQSDCEIVLLITDSIYVSVYSKDLLLLDLLHSNAISKGFQSVRYITDENDTRTEMVAW
ncbi:DUF2691 family protein [Brevibacillus sp. NRS-1366]|uniref:DUF2691 family protein n=1 Tax=Brevibacillus sp. NRS-1366 TaxID=3233899 RepID=UPI003D19A6C3